MNADIDIARMASLANNQIPQHDYDPRLQHEESPDGGKRKADDSGQPQQRAKRNRYISIACNECKRRKIKCNGQTPCQRCGNLNLECVYAPNCCNGFKDSQEYKEITAHISSLQDQVHALYHELSNLRAQYADGGQMQQPTPQQQQTAIDPSLQSAPFPSHRPPYPPQASPGAPIAPMSPATSRPKSQSQNSQPSFRGPTSNMFNFGIAKNSLQTMGITSQTDGAEDGSGGAGSGSREPSPVASPQNRMQIVTDFHPSKDPIWSVSQDEALRLCRVWEDEMGMMYPVLDINKVTAYAVKLYRFMEAAQRAGLMQQGLPGEDAIDDDDTNILKLVLAIALTVEAYGRSDLGKRIFEYVQPAIDNMVLGNVGIKGIRLLALTAMYEFHRDNEGTSWRIIGLAARVCIELGLHRRETYDAIQDEDERSETMLLFWATYVLDRRWSFGTGMPFALQESDIDPALPKPEERSPYLYAMIQYSAIGAKVWRAVSTPEPPSINADEMGYLDYQVIQWHRGIPPQLKFQHPSVTGSVSTPIGDPSSRAGDRLRIMLYLRANQMRILIYRPVLHSATSIMQHRDQAQTAVDVAKDSVRVLTHINQTSDLYRTQQVLFNAFLTSALAVLFLAVAHTPANFAENVREEFYMALELIRGFSKGSWISKRLWRTIRMLKEIGPKLGLLSKDGESVQNQQQQVKGELDPSRSAAVAMAGLAGHNVDEMSLYPAWSVPTGSSSSPDGMANDLTSLFEAAGGFQPIGNGNLNGGQDGIFPAPTSRADGMENMAHAYGSDEGLSNILKELF